MTPVSQLKVLYLYVLCGHMGGQQDRPRDIYGCMLCGEPHDEDHYNGVSTGANVTMCKLYVT